MASKDETPDFQDLPPRDDPRWPHMKDLLTDFLAKKQAGENPDVFSAFQGLFGDPSDGPKASAEDPKVKQASDIVFELAKETTDAGGQDVTLRALSIYRSIVRHVKAGGSVKFVNKDGTEKLLKVRLKK